MTFWLSYRQRQGFIGLGLKVLYCCGWLYHDMILCNHLRLFHWHSDCRYVLVLMVVAVILYLYRNMIVCNSWTYFKIKSIWCCFGSCIGRKQTMLVCFAWSGNGWYKIKSPSWSTYPSKKVLNSILLYYRIKFSSFRICFSLLAKERYIFI